MAKRVAILQSNYIPWVGYFDIISRVDEFVIYDVVQFTKHDWRNRNRIKTAGGLQWLTIPVVTSGRFGQSVAETRIAAADWTVKHWRSVAQAYARAPFFGQYKDCIATAYQQCATIDRLSAVNRVFIDALAAQFQLSTRLTTAGEYDASGDRTGRLVAICRAAGANVYLSGPSARAYLDVAQFTDASIAVEYVDYSRYPVYPQLHGPFEFGVSALDVLFNLGPAAADYVKALRFTEGSTPLPQPAPPAPGRSSDR
jgi:hypothetical protein